MSIAGYPYDNATMERYYNILKTECVYQLYYHSDEELDKSINAFVYAWYNHVRPHALKDIKLRLKLGTNADNKLGQGVTIMLDHYTVKEED